jgi:hypothetical protein
MIGQATVKYSQSLMLKNDRRKGIGLYKLKPPLEKQPEKRGQAEQQS